MLLPPLKKCQFMSTAFACEACQERRLIYWEGSETSIPPLSLENQKKQGLHLVHLSSFPLYRDELQKFVGNILRFPPTIKNQSLNKVLLVAHITVANCKEKEACHGAFPSLPPPQEKEGKTCRRCNSSPAFQRLVGKKGSKTVYSSLTKKIKEMSFAQKESATRRKRSSDKRLKKGSKNKKRPSRNASAFIRCHSSHTCNRPIGEKCSRNTWAPGGGGRE